MAQRSSSELRRFGLTVGGIFVLLASLSWWRGHMVAPRIMGALGILLVVPGLVAPAVLGPVERAWMRMAEVLGFVNTRIILGVLFYFVFWPVGLVRRFFGDPLNRRLDDGEKSNWVRRTVEPVDPKRYEHQF